jgi:hypothetical protein
MSAMNRLGSPRARLIIPLVGWALAKGRHQSLVSPLARLVIASVLLAGGTSNLFTEKCPAAIQVNNGHPEFTDDSTRADHSNTANADGLNSVFTRPVTMLSELNRPRPLPPGAISVVNTGARIPATGISRVRSRNQLSLQVTAVNALGPSTVEIVYELPENYPTDSCVAPNIGYFQLYRAVDTSISGGYAHWDGRKLDSSWWTEDVHTLPIDLECLAGRYLIIFVPENPECFSVFGASFSFYKGAVSDFNNEEYQWLTDQHPGAGVPILASINCDTCPCPPNVSTQKQGDSATSPSADQTITETLQYLARGSAGAAACGTGSPGNDEFPVIPFTFSMNNHLAAFPTSLGAGVHTPFDFSTHAWINYVDNKIRIRLVDAANSRIVTDLFGWNRSVSRGPSGRRDHLAGFNAHRNRDPRPDDSQVPVV